jgi:hypothetical protein
VSVSFIATLYYVSNKVLAEEWDKDENLAVTGAAISYFLKRTF